MTSLSRFARLLGLPAHQAEDALHSERAARAVLSRRSFFAASGAMAAGTGFAFGAPASSRLTWPLDVSWEPAFGGPALMTQAGEWIPRGALVVMREGRVYRARTVETQQGNPWSRMLEFSGQAT